MIYRDFEDLKISHLAMGTMRLPETDGKIDEEHAQKMVDLAYEKGINYFDTAYEYHMGDSEKFIGKALSKYPRESYFLADKFPGYNLAYMDKIKSIFPEQLEKCGVEYFDFYLIHNVCELNIEQYLDPQYGIYDYVLEKKAEGKIKHLGFSAHGEYDTMKRFLEVYGKDMEFAQIQLNYLDYDFQDAKAKLALLKEYNLPVWVMEPMRGGRLAKLNDEQEARFKALRPEESIAAWAHRFLQEIPEVTTVLTGASSLEQMEENIRTFEEEKPFNEEEKAALAQTVAELSNINTVPCTGCKYCTKHCPMGLDIPRLLSLYNEHSFTGGGFIVPMQMATIDKDHRPNMCIACGMCQLMCPQKITVSKVLGEFAEMLKKPSM